MRAPFAIVLVAASLFASRAALAETFGRLFLTPEQRAQLDEIRLDPNFGKAPELPVSEPSEDGPVGPVVPHLTINGLVIRSSGINASWINGRSITDAGSTREGIRVQTRKLRGGGTVRLELPGGLETVQIKPGQKIDLLSGGIFEPYEYQADEGELFEDDLGAADEVPKGDGSAE